MLTLMRSELLAVVLALATLMTVSAPALGAPADLDPAFATAGVYADSTVISDFGLPVTVVQPDGKILTASATTAGLTGSDIRVSRYETDGTPDAAFGSGGTKVIDIAGFYDYARAMIVLDSGRILLAGNTQTAAGGNSRFLLARLMPNGDLDTAFGGGDGWVANTVGYGDAYAYAIARDGNDIILAGQADGNSTATLDDDFALARFHPRGRPDASFGFNPGNWTTQSLEAGPNEKAVAVWVNPDGTILAAGQTQIGLDIYYALARFTATGFVDTSFSSNGHTTVPLIGTFANIPYEAVQQPDGKVVIAGEAIWDDGTRTDKDFAVARINDDGSMDTSFSDDGVTTVDFALGHDRAYALTLDECGRIVLAGDATNGTNLDLAVARLEPTGVLDTTFGTAGLLTQDFAAHEDAAQSVALQPLDNKLVVSGFAITNDFNRHETRIIRLLGGGPCTSVPYGGAGEQAGLRLRITSPRYGRRIADGRRLVLRGRTQATGRRIAKVQIALQRLTKNRCYLLRSHGARFVSAPRSRRCPRRWLDARGTSSWSFALTRALPRGVYRLYARAVLTDGTVQSGFTERQNAFGFVVR